MELEVSDVSVSEQLLSVWYLGHQSAGVNIPFFIDMYFTVVTVISRMTLSF